MIRPKKLPRDPAQRARAIVDIATGETEVTAGPSETEAQRRGGTKGGRARAKSLTKAQRTEIAAVASQARWKKR